MLALEARREETDRCHMSYFGFHLIFNLPLLVLLFFLSGRGVWPGEMLLAMVGILGIVVAFTSPWDNWAVAKGIWDFPPERVWFRIGKLPVEEYAFFVIQSVEVILLSWTFLRWVTPPQGAPPPRWVGEPQVLRHLAVLFIAWAAWGLAFKEWPNRDRRVHYAWHLFFWFTPVVLLQWIVAGPMLQAYWLQVLVPTLGVGTYLCVADWYAIGRGIWFFDEMQITGWKLGGVMPWEEAAFFYLTSLLVAQTFLILLPVGLR